MFLYQQTLFTEIKLVGERLKNGLFKKEETMVRRIIAQFKKKQDVRVLLFVFSHPELGTCVLEPKDQKTFHLESKDNVLTAARVHLRHLIRYLTANDLHVHTRDVFRKSGHEYHVVSFDLPIVGQEKTLRRLEQGWFRFVPIGEHQFAKQIKRTLGF